MNKNIKKIVSFLMCVSMVLTCFGIMPKQVSAKSEELEQWNFLGDNRKLSWSTYSGDKEPQEIVLTKSVTITKLRLKVPEIYGWKYFRIYEIEALNKNGKNMCTNDLTRGTVSLGGGFKENVTGSAARFLIDGSIGGTSYYQYSPSATEMKEGYIEISFPKPVEVSSVKIWCDWCHDGKGKGAAPKVWEIYGNDTYLFYDDFTEDLYKWSGSDGFSIMNQAVVPAGNKPVAMYAGSSDEKEYRVEADLIGINGVMGIITHYNGNGGYYVTVDKSNQSICVYKNRQLLVEKKWSIDGTGTLAVNILSNKISVWLDEVKMIDYTVETAIAAGRWGVFSSNSTGGFENVRVYNHHEMNDLPGDLPYDAINGMPTYDCDKGDFYVDIDGNDSNLGTISSPFATLHRAQQAVRNARKNNPNKDYVVVIRGGEYQLSESLNFDSDDGENGEYRVMYVAYDDETPSIIDTSLVSINRTSVAANTESMLTISGTEDNHACNLDFIGIRFANYDGDVIKLENVSSVGIYECEFENIKGNAITVGNGSSALEIANNCIINIEGYGIKIDDEISDETSGTIINNAINYPRGINVTDNYMDNCGKTNGVESIKAGFTNHTTIKGNTIKNSVDTGIIVGLEAGNETNVNHHNSVVQNIVCAVKVHDSEVASTVRDNVKDATLAASGKAGCPEGKSGDMNGDSEVNIVDIIRIKRNLNENKMKIQRVNADLNKDYSVDQKDVSELRKIIASQENMPIVSDVPVTFISQKVDNPKFVNNYLRQQDVIASTSGNSEKLDGIISGNTYSYDSVDKIENPQEFVYEWNTPVTANTLRLYANYASKQAPAHLQIYVKKYGYWYKAQNCKLSWDEVDTAYYEYVDVTVPAKDVTGLKVVVEEANQVWNHFIITEMELFNVESDKEEYRLIFNDEFDTLLDNNKWLTKYLPHATTYNSDTTYRMDDGNLVLYLDENMSQYADYTSMKASSIQTYEKNLLHPGAVTENVSNVDLYESFTCKYGYFEMRAKLPACGGGGHMAWWLVGTQDDAQVDGTGSVETGEIDILETTFLRTNLFAPKVHAWTDSRLSEYENNVTLKGDFVNEYHIYAMDWTPSGITFYVDGEIVGYTSQSPDYRMAMLISMYTDGAGWSGNSNGIWPKECYIDYVRVYQKTQGYVMQ